MLAPKGFCIDQRSFEKSNDIVSILAVDCFLVENDKISLKTFRKPLSAIISATIFELEKMQSSEDEFFFEIENKEDFSKILNELNLETIEIINYEKNDDLIFSYILKENNLLINEKDYYLSKVFFIEKNKLIILSLINYSKYDNKKETKRLLMEYVNNIKLSNKKINYEKLK